jgi:triacylglycerol lipase
MRLRVYSSQLRLAAIASILLAAACSPADMATGPSLREAVDATRPAHDPILFVHGWMSSSAAWTTMVGRFKADGWTDAELTNWTYDSSVSNANTAELVRNKVDSILAATGGRRVDIITHSMGALSARYYIKYLGGDGKVDAIVSLGGPNHGTRTAALCDQVSCIEMRLNSSFLASLNDVDETWGRAHYATWWSNCDEVILPRKSTILSGATNNQTACLDHSELHEDLTVYGQVKGWVAP